MWSSGLQNLAGVGCHQLATLACLAEGQCAQTMLDALCLQANKQGLLDVDLTCQLNVELSWKTLPCLPSCIRLAQVE